MIIFRFADTQSGRTDREDIADHPGIEILAYGYFRVTRDADFEISDEVMERLEGGAPETPRQPNPRDFDAKPIWARTLVISAGVIMNMLFAFATYVFLAAQYGVSAERIRQLEKNAMKKVKTYMEA